jgi:hypothetical protein
MGISDTFEGCLEYPYEILENLCIPDKQYRTDLKEVLPQMAEEIKQYA